VRSESFNSNIFQQTTRLEKQKPASREVKPRSQREPRVLASKESDSPEKGASPPGRKRKGEDADKGDKENEVNDSKPASRAKSLSHVHKKPKQRAKKAAAATLVPGTMGRSRRFAF